MGLARGEAPSHPSLRNLNIVFYSHFLFFLLDFGVQEVFHWIRDEILRITVVSKPRFEAFADFFEKSRFFDIVRDS